MNLHNRIEELAGMMTIDLSMLRIATGDWRVHEIDKRQFTNVTPNIDQDVLDALLLGAPLPQVVMQLDSEGKYEVFSGHAVMATASVLASNPDDYEPRWLVRRAVQTYIKVVVFYPTVPREDAVFLARKFYNADVE